MDIFDVVADYESRGLYKYAAELNKVSFLFQKKESPKTISEEHPRDIKKKLEDVADMVFGERGVEDAIKYLRKYEKDPRTKEKIKYWTQMTGQPEPTKLQGDRQEAQKVIEKTVNRMIGEKLMQKVASSLIGVSSRLMIRGLEKEAAMVQKSLLEYLNKYSADAKETFKVPSIEEFTEGIDFSQDKDALMRAYLKYEDVFKSAHDTVNDFIAEVTRLLRTYDRDKDISSDERLKYAEKKVEIVRKYDRKINNIYRELERYARAH